MEEGWTGYFDLSAPLLPGLLLSPTGKLLFIPQSPPLVGPHGLVMWLGTSQALPGASTHPPYRPTSSSSHSPARGRSRLQMSMVKSVLLLLKMEVSEDMSAAIMTATISPRRPVGEGQLLRVLVACWQSSSHLQLLLSWGPFSAFSFLQGLVVGRAPSHP